jgi:hypothetical protein
MVEVEVEEDDEDENVCMPIQMNNNYVNANNSDIDENNQDEEEEEEEDDDDSDAEVINITQNPLYHILGAYLENEKGVNIADIFSSIKRSIDRNTQALTNIEKLLARKYASKS